MRTILGNTINNMIVIMIVYGVGFLVVFGLMVFLNTHSRANGNLQETVVVNLLHDDKAVGKITYPSNRDARGSLPDFWKTGFPSESPHKWSVLVEILKVESGHAYDVAIIDKDNYISAGKVVHDSSKALTFRLQFPDWFSKEGRIVVGHKARPSPYLSGEIIASTKVGRFARPGQ